MPKHQNEPQPHPNMYPIVPNTQNRVEIKRFHQGVFAVCRVLALHPEELGNIMAQAAHELVECARKECPLNLPCRDQYRP